MSQSSVKNKNLGPSDEDTVQCFFYSPSLSFCQETWDTFCKKINSRIESLAKEYLWHKDEFKVFLPIDDQKREESPPYLTSSTAFGDNIEDEWFIVYIILELTKEYKDLIVQVQDNDGDFLLIEAADHLPSWANPETTENRVFIHANHIHLIPQHVANFEDKLSLNDAIQLIAKFSNETIVSLEIEQAILNRIGKYPEKIKDNTHNAVVKLPIEIAALLKLKPKLIAPIVNAYCHHDVIDAKAFKDVSFTNWTTVTVKFTKCLYAMLLYSKNYNSNKHINQKDNKNVLGIKLACGFHMIMKQSSDIYASKEYLIFLNSLNENGYFKNNIEGSEEYTKLLQNAKKFFAAVECPIESNISNDITKIMRTEEYLNAKELLQANNGTASNLTEDDDDWLTLRPEQLNEMLNSRYGKKTKFQKGDVLTPQTITTELKNFLKQTSDFEGIETSSKDPLENKIDFCPDQFVNSVDKMLKVLSTNDDKVDMENIESDLSDDAMSHSEDENEIDKELNETLHGATESLSDNKKILENMIQSMKEEKASMGPSSNLISNVGLSKTDFLDSDDD